MYGIFTYIWAIFGVNVGKYSIHGASGNHFCHDFRDLCRVTPLIPIEPQEIPFRINVGPIQAAWSARRHKYPPPVVVWMVQFDHLGGLYMFEHLHIYTLLLDCVGHTKYTSAYECTTFGGVFVNFLSGNCVTWNWATSGLSRSIANRCFFEPLPGRQRLYLFDLHMPVCGLPVRFMVFLSPYTNQTIHLDTWYEIITDHLWKGHSASMFPYEKPFLAFESFPDRFSLEAIDGLICRKRLC